MLLCWALLRVRPIHTKHTGQYVPNMPTAPGILAQAWVSNMLFQVCGVRLLHVLRSSHGKLSTAHYHCTVGWALPGLQPQGHPQEHNPAEWDLALLAQLKCFPVNPRPSETEAEFQFNQVKCQLLFIIRNSFNRFPAWALGSQREVQDREISPALSSCLPEMAVFTLYIVSPMHLAGLSNPFHDLQLGPLEIIRTKCHKVYKQEDALEKYALVWVRLPSSFEYFSSMSWPERC